MRRGTPADVVGAVAAAATEPVVRALPVMIAGLDASVRLVGLAARALPELLERGICQGIAGPTVVQAGEHLHRVPADSQTPSSWRFAASRLLTPPRPGPLAAPPSTAEQRPVELEISPSAQPGNVKADLWSGGWLLCALSSLAIDVDGQPLDEVAETASNLESSWEADERAVHATARIDVSLLLRLLNADRITIRWDGGTATLRPTTSEAARELAALLDSQ